jgi:hypothetical protein
MCAFGSSFAGFASQCITQFLLRRRLASASDGPGGGSVIAGNALVWQRAQPNSLV